jgi:hypothetical protein
VIFRGLPEDHSEAILCTPILYASKVTVIGSSGGEYLPAFSSN